MPHYPAFLTGFAVLIFVTGISPSVSAGEKARGNLEQLKFLAGAWKGTIGEDLVEEHWTEPAGDAMVGMFRWVGKNGKTRLFELLSIQADAKGPTLRLRHFDGSFNPWKSELERIPALAMTEHDAARVLFTNPAKDGGLKGIEYAVREGNQLHITVMFQDEKRATLRFRLERMR